MPTLRLLVVAPTADDTDIGEAATAHAWAARLAERHDVTLLTYQKAGHEPLAPRLPAARVVEWSDLPGVGRFERFNSLAKPGYLLFHQRARRWLREVQQRGERFDVAHQLCPMALRYPSPVTGSGIPLVLGPVAGSLPTPPGFRSEVRQAAWYTRLRAVDGLRRRHDPILRRTYEQAALVLGAAPYVAALAAEAGAPRFAVMDQIGLERLPAAPPRSPSRPGVLRMLFVGRVIRTKGVRDAIRALAHLPDLPEVTLDVVGDGEDRAACQAEAASAGLEGRVRFHGALPHAAALDRFRAADAFCFPSFREPQGIVVVEALAHGLPVVTATGGGPMALVDGSCALLVEPTAPAPFAADLASAIRRLAVDLDLRARLAAGARARAEAHRWESKLAWLDEHYAEVVARSAPLAAAR